MKAKVPIRGKSRVSISVRDGIDVVLLPSSVTLFRAHRRSSHNCSHFEVTCKSANRDSRKTLSTGRVARLLMRMPVRVSLTSDTRRKPLPSFSCA